MIVFYGGEDQVTKMIAKRLVSYVVNEPVDFEDVNPRDYGTKALSKLDQIVKLGITSPTICVFDSDGDCILEILNAHTSNGWKSNKCAINFAVDEAESWLLADREGFSSFFEIDISKLPYIDDQKDELSYMISYKTSLYILQQLMPLSRKQKYRDELVCHERNKKPSNYNNLLQPFIMNSWNIDNAQKNSSSLRRAIKRCILALNK